MFSSDIFVERSSQSTDRRHSKKKSFTRHKWNELMTLFDIISESFNRISIISRWRIDSVWRAFSSNAVRVRSESFSEKQGFPKRIDIGQIFKTRSLCDKRYSDRFQFCVVALYLRNPRRHLHSIYYVQDSPEFRKKDIWKSITAQL